MSVPVQRLTILIVFKEEDGRLELTPHIDVIQNANDLNYKNPWPSIFRKIDTALHCILCNWGFSKRSSFWENSCLRRLVDWCWLSTSLEIICSHMIATTSKNKIGGVGKTVEIDESLFGEEFNCNLILTILCNFVLFHNSILEFN